MKRQILLIVYTMASIAIQAYDAKIDGIFYNFLDSEAEVTNNRTEDYSGIVDIPTSVTYNGKNYKVTKIGNKAFFGCTRLSSLKIPEGVNTIGEEACAYCIELISVNLPKSLSGIEKATFYQCGKLSSIAIPPSVTYIGDKAFFGCQSIPSVTIPKGVSSIGDKAFFGCQSIPSVTIPKGVSSIGDKAFSGCENISSFCVEEENLYYDSRNNCNAIIETESNTLIYGCVKTVIPKSVKEIGASAFYALRELTSINIPCGVTTIADQAFCMSGLTSVSIPDGVTFIGQQAFSECKALVSVTIPNSVKEIGKSAFLWCTNLSSISIGSGIVSVGTLAFDGTAWYDNQPDGIIYIGKIAYRYKGDMPEGTHVKIEDGCYEISSYAFQGYTGLTSVTIPNSVVSIGDYSFQGCTGLTSVTIPNSVISIGNSSFWGCTGLTSVTIPNSVISIGNSSFWGCTGLESINIPSSVTSIGFTAFYDCNNLSSVIVESKMPLTIFYATFSNMENATLYVPAGCIAKYSTANYWEDFKEIKEFQENRIKEGGIYYKLDDEKMMAEVTYMPNDGYYSGKVIIPSSITYGGKNYIVSCIGGEAFLNCNELSAVIIPNSITRIVSSAFYGCVSLKTISIPECVVSIGDNVFKDCTGLSSVKMESNIPSKIYANTFSSRSNATLYVPYNYKTIYEKEDYWKDFKEIIEYIPQLDGICYCLDKEKETAGVIPMPNNEKYVGNIIIPSSVYYGGSTFDVTNIREYAFFECEELTSITIPNSINEIGDNAFQGCIALSSMSIPNGVTSINDGTFAYCSALTSITIPSTVTSINYKSFLGCTGVTSINVEADNTSYDSRNNCNAIIETETNTLVHGCVNTNIPESVTEIGKCAFQSIPLAVVHLPKNLKRIGELAFADCEEVLVVFIPNMVSTIGRGAFSNCKKLSGVVIPENLTNIEDEVFDCCYNLKSIKVEWKKPIIIGEKAFPSRSNATLHVPIGSKSVYASTMHWMEFRKIVESIKGDVNVDEDVDVIDVVDIARFVVGIPSKTFEEILADINKDCFVNLSDAITLVNDIAGEQNFVKGLVAPEHITSNDALMLADTNGSLSLCLNNERQYTAFQFDLYVPEGADVTKMLLNAERKQKHQLLYNKVEEGHYRVAALSANNNEFMGNEGELLNIALTGVSGDEVSVRNIHFFDMTGQDYQFEDINGSTTTSVRQIENGGLIMENSIYDLQGRRRSTLQRGINIVGGKKVIVK